MSHSINFAFSAVPAPENHFPSAPTESAVDLTAAKMLGFEELAKSLKDVRLLIVVEKTDYRTYVSSLLSVKIMPERIARQVGYAETQIP